MIPTRVLLADDQTLFRGALACALMSQEDFEVVGEAGNGLEAVELAKSLQPDVVLMDVTLPVIDGLEAARMLRAQVPCTKIVMLTVSDDDDHLVGALRMGADGYLLKDLRTDQLFEMLRAVRRHETPISQCLVGRLVEKLRSANIALPQEEPVESAELSHRELEILRLVAAGLSNREIGRRLCIAEGTVKNHVHNALHKLHMDNRIQAAAYVVRNGLASSVLT